jgi:octaprenyl-diphosphate synthase
MTLPLIFALNHASKQERNWLINSVKRHNKDKKRVKEVIAYVKASGGLEYATSKMHAFKQEALQLLQTYPDSPYRQALDLMVNYVVDRKQ